MALIHGFMIAAFTVVGASAPQQPAAPAGKTVCAGCHQEVAAQFDRSAHSELVLKDGSSQFDGCEACLRCHRKGHAMEWAGSQHQMAGVSCLDCHKIHQSRKVMGELVGVEGMAVSHPTAPAEKGSLAKPQTELCLDCHQQITTKLMQQSRHPIREGRMSRSWCRRRAGSHSGRSRCSTSSCTTRGWRTSRGSPPTQSSSRARPPAGSRVGFYVGLSWIF